METLWQDLRIGFRQLLADKGFSIAAILTLALGIGATATILTVVNSVLLKELPYSDHARVMVLQGSLKDKGEDNTWPDSQMDLADWRQRSTVFSDMSMFANLAYRHLTGQ